MSERSELSRADAMAFLVALTELSRRHRIIIGAYSSDPAWLERAAVNADLSDHREVLGAYVLGDEYEVYQDGDANPAFHWQSQP